MRITEEKHMTVQDAPLANSLAELICTLNPYPYE